MSNLPLMTAFFNILKEPLLVQKQTIHPQKALILSFSETESLSVWHHQEGARLLDAKSIGARGVKKVLLRQVIVTPL